MYYDIKAPFSTSVMKWRGAVTDRQQKAALLKNIWAVIMMTSTRVIAELFLIECFLVYKVQIESVAGLSHNMPSDVRTIVIIVMVHVSADIFADILDVQTLYVNGTYHICTLAAILTIRPEQYVRK